MGSDFVLALGEGVVVVLAHALALAPV